MFFYNQFVEIGIQTRSRQCTWLISFKSPVAFNIYLSSPFYSCHVFVEDVGTVFLSNFSQSDFGWLSPCWSFNMPRIPCQLMLRCRSLLIFRLSLIGSKCASEVDLSISYSISWAGALRSDYLSFSHVKTDQWFRCGQSDHPAECSPSTVHPLALEAILLFLHLLLH